MAKGGKRPGAGRPPKADEDRVRDIALSSAIRVHGSEEAAFDYLFKHTEPSLVKFAFEHAFGKPKERQQVEHSGNGIALNIIMPDGD